VAISINGGAGKFLSYVAALLSKLLLAHNVFTLLEMPGWFDL